MEKFRAEWCEKGKEGGPALEWAGGKEREKQKLNSGMQKVLERYRQMQREREGEADTQM